MKMNGNYFRFFSLILLGSVFIFGLTKAGTFAYKSVFAEDDSFTSNTYIGPVSVEGMSSDEARTAVQSAISNWQANSKITLSYGDARVSVPAESIQFLIKESIIEAENSGVNPLLVEVNANNLNALLAESIPETVVHAVNMDQLKKEIESKVGLLEEGKQNLSLIAFLNPESGISEGVLSEATIQSGYISELAKPYSIKIEPNSTFSFLQDFAPNFPSWSDELLTYTASAMYKASLETNLQVVDRQISSVKPNHIDLGFEAKINRNKIDLMVKNPNDFPVRMTFQSSENGKLNVKMTGYRLNNQYKVRLSAVKSFQFRKVVQYSPNLDQGEETVKQAGFNGSAVTVYRDVYSKNGQKLDSVPISEDFYLPVNEIVVKSTLTVPVEDHVSSGELNGENLTEEELIDKLLKDIQNNSGKTDNANRTEAETN